MKYKGLVVSTFLIFLALFMIVSEDGFSSVLSPIAESGCRASIFTLTDPSGDTTYLHLRTKQIFSSTGYKIVTRLYWTGNCLYVKAVGIEPPTGPAGQALSPARAMISIEEIKDGSYQVVLFWSSGISKIRSETYKLEKYEGNISLDRVESDTGTVFFANVLYLTPWLLLCIGLLYVLFFMLMKIIRRLRTARETSPIDSQPLAFCP